MFKQLLKRLSNDGGFSLVEILVAIVILSVSASVVLSGLGSVSSQSTKDNVRQENSLALSVATEAVKATEFDCNLTLAQNRKLVSLPTNTTITSIEEMSTNGVDSWVPCNGEATIQRINLSYRDPASNSVITSSVINTIDGFAALSGDNSGAYIEAVPNQNVEVGTPKVLDLDVIESSNSKHNWSFSCANCISSAFTLSFDNRAKTMTITASAASLPADVVLLANEPGGIELAATFVITTTCPVTAEVGTCATATPKPGQSASSGEKGGKSNKATRKDRSKKTYDRQHGFGYGFGKGYDH
ncbi:MAG: type II secretion system protein [Micrococcales bacterium]